MTEDRLALLKQFNIELSLDHYNMENCSMFGELVKVETDLAQCLLVFPQLSDSEWSRVRAIVDFDSAMKLAAFSIRMGSTAVEREDRDSLRAGVIALVLDQDHLDYRDVFTMLAILHDAATRISAPFEEICRAAAARHPAAGTDCSGRLSLPPRLYAVFAIYGGSVHPGWRCRILSNPPLLIQQIYPAKKMGVWFQLSSGFSSLFCPVLSGMDHSRSRISEAHMDFDLDRFGREVTIRPSLAICGLPSEDDLMQCETVLGLQLPKSYKLFCTAFGGGMLGNWYRVYCASATGGFDIIAANEVYRTADLSHYSTGQKPDTHLSSLGRSLSSRIVMVTLRTD